MTPTLLVILDGMADDPIPELGYRTPLQVARKPYLDQLAAMGRNGLIKTVPKGIEVNSDTAILSILGYDIKRHNYGRAYFEALGLGIPITPNESVIRANLTTIQDDILIDFTAGHIESNEAKLLIDSLNRHFNSEEIVFYAGESYKNIAKIPYRVQSLHATSPHNCIGMHIQSLYPTSTNLGEKALEKRLKQVIDKSRAILTKHPINLKRIERGVLPANNICLWSFSKGYDITTFNTLHNKQLKGCVIAGTNLIKGIGKAVGFDTPQVYGATGGLNTNYDEKVSNSLKSLTNYDFVLLHIEACDIVSHDGDYRKKIEIIETIDQKVIKPIYNYLLQKPNSLNVAILPDHSTSCITKMHTNSAVPYILVSDKTHPDNIEIFSEHTAINSSVNSSYPDLLIKQLLKLS